MSVLELRRYALRPLTRPAFVELFESTFIEPQEAVGCRVGGTFLERTDPDTFVWLRGFTDMAARHEALSAFYLGPVWQAHRDRANRYIVDSNDVWLLRPTDPPHPPPPPVRPRPAGAGPGAQDYCGEEWVIVTVYTHPADDRLSNTLAREMPAILENILQVAVGTWRTEPAENTFDQLPVRADNVFIWSATFPDHDSYTDGIGKLNVNLFIPQLGSPAVTREQLTLQPTRRSSHPSSQRRHQCPQ